jgi:hypothetical protein
MAELSNQLFDSAALLNDESRASTDVVLIHKLRDASMLMTLAAQELQILQLKYEKLESNFDLLT